MDKFGRAEWDNFNMAIAMIMCTRSIDPRTKHGCYVVDKHNKPLSAGYNGPLRGTNDDEVSLSPPEKYNELEHSERNAVYNRSSSIEGATAYITGHPCINCFRALVQSGVAKIVYGPIPSVSLSDDEVRSIKKMLKGSKVEFVEFKGNFWEPFDILENYLKTKNIFRGKDEANRKDQFSSR